MLIYIHSNIIYRVYLIELIAMSLKLLVKILQSLVCENICDRSTFSGVAQVH